MSYGLSALGSVGLSREQAFGALGSLAGESGRNLDTGAYNPNDPNGGSIGIGQWHSDRRKALETFAKTSKYGLNDFRTQMDFVAHELKNSHKGVLDAMLGATTRHKAAEIWTKKYEVPNKKYEHLSARKANADYYAKLAASGPATPQAAVDAAGSPLDVDYAADSSLTGATLSYAPEPAEAKGPFEAMLGGMAGAVSGLAGDLGAMTGMSSKTAAADAESRNQAAQADNSFFGDTSIGAIVGSIAGGLMAGPMGAVVGGLAGQGINRALDKIGDDVQTKANKTEEEGLVGGLGRAIDRSIGSLFGLGRQTQQYEQQQMDENYFPDAPQGTNNGESKGFSYDDLSGPGKTAYNESKQVRDAVDSGKGGLW